MLAQLIIEAPALGYEVALAEVLRDRRIAHLNAETGQGIRNSLHLIGLAADINAYQQGIYLSETEAYADLGSFWENLHPLCRWGGRFLKPDGNHFSLSWEGRA